MFLTAQRTPFFFTVIASSGGFILKVFTGNIPRLVNLTVMLTKASPSLLSGCVAATRKMSCAERPLRVHKLLIYKTIIPKPAASSVELYSTQLLAVSQ